jgi:hypothetical protein
MAKEKARRDELDLQAAALAKQPRLLMIGRNDVQAGPDQTGAGELLCSRLRSSRQ